MVAPDIKFGRAERVEERHHHDPFKFPDGFLWGTATSAHQIEGGNNKNDWGEWEQGPGRIAGGERSGRAADSWSLWKKDLELEKKLYLNAYRLSVEWSRLEPEPGQWDESALRHYREVLEAHKKEGIKIMLTLHHFTLPLWLARRGGWESSVAVRKFKKFVEKVVLEYGDLVDFWITVNEPVIYLTQGYLYGVWPPGKKSVWRLLRSFFRMARAHRAAYRAIHRLCKKKFGIKARVGIAQNVISYSPYRRHALGDIIFVRIMDWLWNHSFYDFTRRCHDFIGINYYFHYRVAFAVKNPRQFFMQVHKEDREASALGWEINAPGIFQAIQDMLIYEKPIYITENGVATSNDHKRVRFLVAHLKEVYHAVKSGADVRGYFYWSLLDNFEWDKGFLPRFGLFEVDYQTFERQPRRSSEIYGRIVRENGIAHDLMKFMGHGI